MKDEEVMGIMPRGDDFKVSRDHGYDDYKCMQRLCVANRFGKCISPSRCVIGKDGRCKGYKERKI